jgi:hypothetical protein
MGHASYALSRPRLLTCPCCFHPVGRHVMACRTHRHSGDGRLINPGSLQHGLLDLGSQTEHSPARQRVIPIASRAVGLDTHASAQCLVARPAAKAVYAIECDTGSVWSAAGDHAMLALLLVAVGCCCHDQLLLNQYTRATWAPALGVASTCKGGRQWLLLVGVGVRRIRITMPASVVSGFSAARAHRALAEP